MMSFDEVEAGELEAFPTGEILVSSEAPTNVRRPPRAHGTARPFADAAVDDVVGLAWGTVPEDAPLDRDDCERALLAAIAAGTDTARTSYADWLEEHSEHARARYLRLEQLVQRLERGDPRLEGCTRQLREAAQYIGADWRARVARLRVEGCAPRELGCTARWESLERTDRETVRYCTACCRHVYYFGSVDEARALARRGHCVAIDLGAERWQNDLYDAGIRCSCCTRRVVSRARFCPHCGYALRGGLMLAGLFAVDHGAD